MATSTLPRLVMADPSDAELCEATASLLAAMPGTTLGPRLSRLLAMVCSVYCFPRGADGRAERLTESLITYLHARHALLRSAQLTPAGLDEWAAGVPLTVLRAALRACARHLRSGGEAR
ncbi:hypothetical protein ACNTMW_31060 [Planosporangium sp. 12N6]|uniref:hypothetical protein n=1 Tax=Planosporangium spinosum TaxID=3402278 RepID=UPI003CF4F534